MKKVLDWSLSATEIPDGGIAESVLATTAEQRADLAKALDLVSVESLSVRQRIEPLGRARYRFAGTISARLTQACVVTLEPVMSRLEEPFDVEFWPPEQIPDDGDAEREALAVPEREPIEHNRLAIGRVIFETFAAAINPYPRKDGALFEWEDEAGSAPGSSDAGNPFAALAKWKQKPE